jgi:hypothetical protein
MGHAMGGSSAPVQKNGKSIRPAPSSLCGGVPLSRAVSVSSQRRLVLAAAS